MSFNQTYIAQVELLLDVLPALNQFDCFALKGGTAINLFIRDMPRLSVDIDLTYLPIEPREVFLKNITIELQKFKKIIEGDHFKVQEVYTKARQLSKLIIYNDLTNITVEPNLIFRGSVFNTDTHDLCKLAQDQFFKYSKIKTLAFADLYGGKICAALDRQHPRDLFDIKLLFDNEGISSDLRQAFIVYLCSSNRPIHEMLDPKLDTTAFRQEFDKSFAGMVNKPLSCDELIEVRQLLVNTILNGLTKDERGFLLSLKFGEPEWSLLPIKALDKLPSIQWKIFNIKKMDKKKRISSYEKLKKILEIS